MKKFLKALGILGALLFVAAWIQTNINLMNKDFGLVLKANFVIMLIAAAIVAIVMAFANGKCPACGKRLLVKKHYCYHCGKKLDD